MPNYSLETLLPTLCLLQTAVPCLHTSIGSYSLLSWALRLSCWNNLAKSGLQKLNAKPLYLAIFMMFFLSFFPFSCPSQSRGGFQTIFPIHSAKCFECLLRARHSARHWENRNYTSSPNTCPSKECTGYCRVERNYREIVNMCTWVSELLM